MYKKHYNNMKKLDFFVASLLAAVVSLLFAGCTAEEDSPIQKPVICPVDDVFKQVVNGSVDMSYSLFAKVNENAKTDENFMISPLSLMEALAMLANGAEGETLSQIQKTMGFDVGSNEEMNRALNALNSYLSQADVKNKFALANSVWANLDTELKSGFIDTNNRWYDAKFFNQQLSTQQTMNDINSWCKKNTDGCIEKFLESPLGEDAKLLILNVLYFKGQWSNKFSKENTRTADFHNIDGTKSSVKMMSQNEEFYAYIGEKMDVVEFPYGNKTFCMDVLLPHEGENLSDCIKDLDKSTMDNIFKSMHVHKVKVEMPRMQIKYDTSLKDILIDMGMVNAFMSDKVELTSMYDDNTPVSNVKQVTYLEVDEEGTKAAAITGVLMYNSIGGNGFTFSMNRPYMFIIREKESGAILFMGRVMREPNS